MFALQTSTRTTDAAAQVATANHDLIATRTTAQPKGTGQRSLATNAPNSIGRDYGQARIDVADFPFNLSTVPTRAVQIVVQHGSEHSRELFARRRDDALGEFFAFSVGHLFNNVEHFAVEVRRDAARAYRLGARDYAREYVHPKASQVGMEQPDRRQQWRIVFDVGLS